MTLIILSIILSSLLILQGKYCIQSHQCYKLQNAFLRLRSHDAVMIWKRNKIITERPPVHTMPAWRPSEDGTKWKRNSYRYEMKTNSIWHRVNTCQFITESWRYQSSLLRRGPLTASCWLSDCFEYTRKSAREGRKEPLPNNVCEFAFQRTNRAFLSSAYFCTIYLGRHFSLNGNVSCCSGNRWSYKM